MIIKLKYTIMLATYYTVLPYCVMHTYPLMMYWLRLFAIFHEVQCLLNFHYDVGCQGLEIDPCIKFRFPQSFFFVIYMHIHILCQSKCIGRDCFLLFSEKYIVYHDYVRRVMELYLSTKFHACQCCSQRDMRVEPEQGEEFTKMATFNLTPYSGI